MDHHVELGSKTFDMNDQWSMARWSGDHNPMHVDAVAARRLITGLPVVHGIHLVLEALGRWTAPVERPWESLQVEFTRPVCVGDRVIFTARPEATATTLTASVGGAPHMTLTLALAQPTAAEPSLPQGELITWGKQPFAEPPAAWLGRTIALPALNGTLPVATLASRWVGGDGVLLLAQLSTAVGMACPGLHSVFSSLRLFKRGTPSTHRFQVQHVEDRFKLVRICVDGPWHGEVRAFVRPPPQVQPGFAEIAAGVNLSLPPGHQTWVIGGSRGLGELAAKFAAAAGSTVLLTYASGEEDAERVAADINERGPGRARVDCFEAGRSSPEELCARHPAPQAVFYFATPRIAGRRNGLFDEARLREFLAIYCQVPAQLAQALEARMAAARGSGAVHFFKPSTTYIDELPNGMVEYAMAKAASEVLSKDLNKRLRHVRLVTPRLPKLATDQTSGIMAGAVRPAAETAGPLFLSTLQASGAQA